MPKRTKDQNKLYIGEYNGLCDVCGFKFKSSDLKERWDGLTVCHDDWEPRHPMDFFRVPPEEVQAGDSDDGQTGPNAWILNNSVPYSEDMNDATWGKQSGALVVTDDTFAPDGEETADLIIGDGAQEATSINFTITSNYDGFPLAVSGYVKASTAPFCIISIYNFDKIRHEYSLQINFAAGEVSSITETNKQNSKSTFSYESVGDSWYRIKMIVYPGANPAGDSLVYQFFPEDWGFGAGADTYFWGAQVEKHSTEVHTYLQTTGTAVETDWWDTTYDVPSGNNDGSL